MAFFDWVSLEPTSLTGEKGLSFLSTVYDTTRNRTIIIGPNETIDHPPSFGDHYFTWNGSDWTEHTSPVGSPPSRYGSAYAYDTVRDKVLMFGGYLNNAPGGYLNELWAFNGSAWSNITPGSGPAARLSPSMTYDPGNDYTVMFGGNLSGFTNGTQETWTWDGSSWTQRFPTTVPPKRANARMVYDARGGYVLMYGGSATFSTAGTDTWIWDGTDWTEVTTANNFNGTGESLVYHADRGRVIVVHKVTGENSETWSFSGTDWENEEPSHFLPDTAFGRSGGFGYAPNNEAVWYHGETWVYRQIMPSSLSVDISDIAFRSFQDQGF
jgi:hypothetical protein